MMIKQEYCMIESEGRLHFPVLEIDTFSQANDGIEDDYDNFKVNECSTSPPNRPSSSSSATESVSSGNSSTSRLSTDFLAQKLRQNFMQKPNIDLKGAFDDSLTSLNWLQNMNGIPFKSNSISNENSPSRPLPSYSNQSASQPFHPRTSPSTHDQERLDYRLSSTTKPPYSYATLICMAMRELGKPKITLSDIYAWIMDNFLYYRLADTSWQNSVRHNLSLNKCFEKVPRRKDEPGKGGFWRINPKYENLLENGIMKRRCSQASTINSSRSTTDYPKYSSQLPQVSTGRTKQQSFIRERSVISPATVFGPSQSSNRHLCHDSIHFTSPPNKRTKNLQLPAISFNTRINKMVYSNDYYAPTTYKFPRKKVLTFKHSTEEYHTAESNTKVDTQMRLFPNSPLLKKTGLLNRSNVDDQFDSIYSSTNQFIDPMDQMLVTLTDTTWSSADSKLGEKFQDSLQLQFDDDTVNHFSMDEGLITSSDTDPSGDGNQFSSATSWSPIEETDNVILSHL